MSGLGAFVDVVDDASGLAGFVEVFDEVDYVNGLAYFTVDFGTLRLIFFRGRGGVGSSVKINIFKYTSKH